MSTLREMGERTRVLLDQLENAAKARGCALTMLKELTDNPAASVQGVGLHLRFQTGLDIPVPMPTDRERLLDILNDSANFLGSEAIRIWREIKVTADEANEICDQALAQHQAQVQEEPTTPSAGT